MSLDLSALTTTTTRSSAAVSSSVRLLETTGTMCERSGVVMAIEQRRAELEELPPRADAPAERAAQLKASEYRAAKQTTTATTPTTIKIEKRLIRGD